MTPQLLLLDTIASEGVDALEAFARIRDGRGVSERELMPLIAECDGLIVKSGNRVGAELLAHAPRLRVIGRAGSGLDNIDVAAARARGVAIITAPEGNACAVAEHVLCMALLLSHRLHEAHAGALAGDFRRANWQGRNLSQLTLGIVGAGHIGRAVAHKLLPLCGAVRVYDPLAIDLASRLPEGALIVRTLGELLETSDVVSLNAPLTPETHGLLGTAELGRMRRGSILINTGRGALIDDRALLAALDVGTVGAAALDVLDPDPPFHAAPPTTSYQHPLLNHPRVYYTPHIAAGTRDALADVAVHLAQKLADFFARLPR